MILYLNYKKLPGLLLCIDFEKAFDSVAWSFLHKVLKSFGFGPMVCQWVQTFIHDIKSTVIVNGTLSPWFIIERGCRQGDPLSPYLFILCVEVLGIMIRENILIKGIMINNVEHKITQFADDTQMTTEGDAISFEQIIKTTEAFGNKSGLYMNAGKTQSIWLGSRKDSPIRYLQHLKMEWNPHKFKILGIWLTADLNECETINYDDKFSEIKILFRAWLKRQITPLGRIAVLKSLILSKLVHLWLLLPNPPDTFMNGLQRMCFKFVWGKKQDRINRATTVKSISNGGLGIVDIKHFANSLKLTWIKKCKYSNHGWKNVISSVLPLITSLDKYGSHIPVDKSKVNKFWEHVLSAYKMFCGKVALESTGEIIAEPLFYNDNIKIDRNTVRPTEWTRKGVISIVHLLQDNGSLITYNEFCAKYDMNVNFLCYLGCTQAVREFLRKKNVAVTDNSAISQRKALSTIYANEKGTQKYYGIFIENGQNPKCCEKWNQELDRHINWNTTFIKIQKIKEVKLKWFQIRLVHRIIGTNRSLKWMNIVNNDQCSFCKNASESIAHLFCDCDIVNRFWTDLKSQLNTKCDHAHNVTFNKELILFGHAERFKSDYVFDLMLLCGKFYIYTCRFGENVPVLNTFMKQFYSRYLVDKQLAFVNMDYPNFRNIWHMYMPLFENLP